MVNDFARLSKIIAYRGFCSRRIAENFIKQGLVKVDGKVVVDLAAKFSFTTIIEINDRLVQKKPVTLWLFHKPKKMLTTSFDPLGRPNVIDFLKPKLKEDHLLTVGRLDWESEGLLLITNCPDLKTRLENPKNKNLRTYLVKIDKSLILPKVWPWELSIAGINYNIAKVILIRQKQGFYYEFSLYEGKNHELRKIVAFLGAKIFMLQRTSYGQWSLGDLPCGDIKKAEN